MNVIDFFRRSSFYLNRVVFYVLFSASVIFVLSFFIPLLFDVALAILIFSIVAIWVDAVLLYSRSGGISANRGVPDRLSNGDENHITIEVENNYGFKIFAKIIDELPVQFQERNWFRKILVTSGTVTTINYAVKPVQRGQL